MFPLMCAERSQKDQIFFSICHTLVNPALGTPFELSSARNNAEIPGDGDILQKRVILQLGKSTKIVDIFVRVSRKSHRWSFILHLTLKHYLRPNHKF